MTSTRNYQYVCFRCETEHTPLVPACQKCGPGGTGHFTLDPFSGRVSLICNGCGEPQTALNSPDIHCSSCHQGTYDWWDIEQGSWFKLNLSVATEDSKGTWLCGEFDGDYEGILQPAQRHSLGLTGQPVFYDIQFKHGYLKNPRKIDTPPVSVARNEVRPFTEPLLFPVDVQTPEGVSRIGLKNFRLHQWTQTADNEGSAGSQLKRHGRLQGIAYGLLDESVQPTSPEPETQQIPARDIQPRSAENFSHSAESNAVDGTQLAEQIDEDSSESENACLICSLFFQLLLFGLTWLACTLKVAGLFWLFMSVVCWLDTTILRNDWRINNKWISLVVGSLLMLSAGAGLTIGYWPSFLQDCQTLAQNALLVCAGALLLSTFLRSCFVKTTLLIFLFVALVTWCKTHDRACKFIPATNSLAISAGHLAQQVAILTDSDVNSDLINDASQNNVNGQRISLDQANQHIELLDDCKNRIYIPFGFNSAVLDAETETKLYRLGQLLQRYDPARIIISGYTSNNAGDETPQGFLNNIKLSEQRTESVRQYLVVNEFIEDSKIETRGYGHNVPILPRDPANDINRRVEVNIQCHLGNNGKE